MKRFSALHPPPAASPMNAAAPRIATMLQRMQRALGNARMQQFAAMQRQHRSDPFEAEADRVADVAKGAPSLHATRAAVEHATGADLSHARVHDDARAERITAALHANAVTRGNDIYVRRGLSGSPDGKRVLAHELTHVAQQRGAAAGRVQCDLMQSMPTTLGIFEIDMADRPGRSAGMEGTIRFVPAPNGPYSAEIGLIQVARLSRPATGQPYDWSRSRTQSARNDLMTTGLDGAERGWMVDTDNSNKDRTSSVGPNYIEQWNIRPPRNQFGFLRSPTDLQATSLYDFPGFEEDLDFRFETVAKATDTQTIYGALHWGFGIRSGALVNEYARAVDAESPEFNEALERFRGYYTHEAVVLYFDTDADVPQAGEEAKLRGFLDYLNRYPDVLLQLDGYADERGTERHNEELALRRAGNVQTMLAHLGVATSRVSLVMGWGRTAAFAPGRTAGQLQANRRVVINFVRTAGTPIVMP